MPATDVRTNLTIALQTKGFDRGLRDMMGVSQKTLDGLKKQALAYTKVQTALDTLQAKIRDLTKVQLDATREMEKIGDKASEAYKKQEQRLKDAVDQTKKYRREMGLLEQVHKGDAQAMERITRAQQDLLRLQKQSQQQGRWAGTQGLFQGMGMGGMAGLFMQRGPGFWRQFAGQRVGGLFRRIGQAGAGLAQAPFSGIQGLQQALSAIPGGGVLAGQLGAVAQHSQQALQWQREQLQLAPYIESRAGRGARARLGEIGTELTGLSAQRQGLAAPRAMAETLPTNRPGARATKFRGPLDILWGRPKGLKLASFQTDQEREADARGQTNRMINAQETNIKAREDKLKDERKAILARTPMGQIASAGRQLLGMGRREAAQQAAQVFQVAGTRFEGRPGQRRQLETAFAAQTMYGVGPEAAGAFLLAGRRGGLVGGRGQGPEALTDALKDAFDMGLEGAEITRYMQTVAQGIQEFQQSGIPFNKDSLKSMTLEMGRAGIGGPRAERMAQGLQQYVQGIGQRGITGGLDLMMMQQFGGFQGGGAQAYEQAILRMEMMQQGGLGKAAPGTPLGNLIQSWYKMGGGAQEGGATFARQMLGAAGMQVSQGEIMAIIERLTGEQLLTPEQREAYAIDVSGEAARRKEGRARGPKTTQDLINMAAARVREMGPNLIKQAAIMDQQLTVGEKALNAVQALETSSINLNNTFIDLAGPALTSFSNAMLDFTIEFNRLIKEEGGIAGAIRKMLIGV